MASSRCRPTKSAKKKKKNAKLVDLPQQTSCLLCIPPQVMDITFRVISNTSEEKKEQEPAVLAPHDDGRTKLDDLPSDLISNILSKLPIRSLLQCRTVSKHWNHLTRNPQFINHYHQLSRVHCQQLTYVFPSFKRRVGLTDLFIFGKDEETSRIPLKRDWQGTSYVVLHSCNGFLLLYARGNYIGRYEPIPNFIIFNPITNETIIDIPQPPKDAPKAVSFVFDAKTQKYKIVLEFRYIITLGETSWRKLSGPCNQYVSGTFEESVFFNGALYWTHCYDDVIISLDICAEQYKILGRPLQGVPMEECSRCYLVEHDNKLVFIVFDCMSQQLQTWSLVDDHEGTWLYQSTNTMDDFLSRHYCNQHLFIVGSQVGNDSLLLHHLDGNTDLHSGYQDTYGLWERAWRQSFIYTPKLGGHVSNFIANSLESWADFRFLHFIPNLASFYSSN